MLLHVLASLLLATPAAAAPTKPVKEAANRTPPTATSAWIRSNPVPGRPSAGYLTITGGDTPDKLVAVTSPGLRIELHSMSMDGSVMKMATLDSVAVPAGSHVSFASGGNHLMIYGLANSARTVPLTLVFGGGAKVTTVAQVRAPGDVAPVDAHGAH